MIGHQQIVIVDANKAEIIHNQTLPGVDVGDEYDQDDFYQSIGALDLNALNKRRGSREFEDAIKYEGGDQDFNKEKTKKPEDITSRPYLALSTTHQSQISGDATKTTQVSLQLQTGVQSKRVVQGPAHMQSSLFSPLEFAPALTGLNSRASQDAPSSAGALDRTFYQRVSQLLAQSGEEFDENLATQVLQRVQRNIDGRPETASDDFESDSSRAQNDEPLSQSFDLSKSGLESESLDSLDRAILHEKIQEEKSRVSLMHPSDWVADIGNNGNSLALFDRSQQRHNRVFKFKENKQELLYVYSIVLGKSQFKPVEHTLDMRALLHDNEVLSFGFDDFNSGFSQICVQAKNLSLYIIDFTSKKVVRRIRDPVSVSFRGIFYDLQNQAKHLPQYAGLKEFIQAQEAEGNCVMVPKLNPDFVAVQQGKTRVVKIFSLKSQTFIREFTADASSKTLDEILAEAIPAPKPVEISSRAQIKLNVERRQQNIQKNEELEED